VIDPSVKSPVGIEYGVEYQFGNFDQCLEAKANLKTDGVDIESKYCLVDVELDGFSMRHAAVRHQEVSKHDSSNHQERRDVDSATGIAMFAV
jgi:Nose resistant-to-fluoxetine protein, N-terminal domain